MPQLPSVFISYNPDSDVEQTLAVRLHTIGAVHGFNMMLPDRTRAITGVTNETRSRILLSDYFILFSTTTLSRTVRDEIAIAFSKLHDRSKILVVYDKKVGKNLAGAENFTEIFIDRTAPVDVIMDAIIKTVKAKQTNSQAGGFLSVLGPILLTAVGLFALSTLVDDDTSHTRKSNSKPKKAKKAAKRTIKKLG